MTYLKRLTVSWAGKKKSNKYIAKPSGAHPQDKSMPLVVLLRDVLGVAGTSAEVKKIKNTGKILIDGKVCKDIKRGLGLFDVLTLLDKNYRVIIRGKPRLIEISDEEGKVKLCRITGKKIIPSGKLQLNLHDGRNILTDKKDYSVNDSILITLPEQEIKESIKFGPGCLVMLKSGEIVKVKNIERGLHKKMILEDSKEIPFKDFIVVGTEKPIIKVSE